jgi:signal transduction histidine kinase
VAVLVSLLGMAYIAERTRVRVQKDLFIARNNFQMAEERQRAINAELQNEIQLRIQSEKALTQSESRYRALFEESAVSLWEEDWSKVKSYLDELPQEAVDDLFAYLKQNPKVLEQCIGLIQVTAVNRATLNLYAADSAKTLLKNISVILPSQIASYMLERVVSLYLNRRYDAEHNAQTLNGRPLSLLISSTVPAGYEDSFQRVFTSVYDITERVAMDQEKKRVEQQLQQARQMQAVATLAGGIAHQFNNALAVIFGGLELIESADANDQKNKSFFESLQSSANRMSRLTDQLLAYAHGGKYQPKNFSANDLIHDILKSDRIKPAPSIRISTELAADIHPACGDVTQIKMVVEAVLANALESFSNGGEITISTYNQDVGEESLNGNGNTLAPGNYAVMSVKDTGVGMDQETRQRIFEPFFTTKFFGRGLGMAAAYGIVTNHDGMITVESAPQKGTRVNIYLPAADSRQNRPRHRAPIERKMAS